MNSQGTLFFYQRWPWYASIKESGEGAGTRSTGDRGLIPETGPERNPNDRWVPLTFPCGQITIWIAFVYTMRYTLKGTKPNRGKEDTAMKFVTIRELRSKTASIRKDLAKEREIVLTANGRPFAVVTPVEPDSVEEELQAIRRARAKVAVERLRTQARAKGLDRLTMDEIDTIVAETRRARRGSR